MSLIGDDREPLALRGRKFLYCGQGIGKGLDRTDDDLLAARERLREFAALAGALALYHRHDTRCSLEIEYALLKLRIEYVAVG